MYVFSVYVLLTIDVYDDDDDDEKISYLIKYFNEKTRRRIMKNIMLHYQI